MRKAIFTLCSTLIAGIVASACGGAQAYLRPQPGSEESLYRDRCGRCHDAFPRHAYSRNEWPAVVERMRFEARLSDPEVERLLGWLTKGDE